MNESKKKKQLVIIDQNNWRQIADHKNNHIRLSLSVHVLTPLLTVLVHVLVSLTLSLSLATM